MNERNYHYDILRIFACFLIICMHSPLPSGSASGIFLSSLSYLTAPGLCIFFVLSGTLLLPIKQDTFAFLKKRLGKVVMPTLCFTLFYLAIEAVNGGNVDWARRLVSIPFSNQGHGVLWFMYTLIGLYLLSPMLSRWLEGASKREVEFYLLLWCVTLCYPVMSLFAEVNTSNTGILYYFQGYAGYFLLGYYLKTYPQTITWRRLSVPLAVSIFTPPLVKVFHLDVDFYSLFWYLSILVAILCVAMFKLFTSIKLNISQGGFLQRAISITSGLSFGIYLVHIAVMRNLLWKMDFIINIPNYYLQWLVVVCLTSLGSWGVCYCISLLPFGDLIIGFKQKRK